MKKKTIFLIIALLAIVVIAGFFLNNLNFAPHYDPDAFIENNPCFKEFHRCKNISIQREENLTFPVHSLLVVDNPEEENEFKEFALTKWNIQSEFQEIKINKKYPRTLIVYSKTSDDSIVNIAECNNENELTEASKTFIGCD